VEKEPSPGGGEKRMRSLVQRLKRLWDTPVEFYGVDRPEPQAGSWHGLLLFVLLLLVLGLLWLVRYLPERTVLVHAWPEAARGVTVARMSTEDIATVAAEAYEVVEGTRQTWPRPTLLGKSQRSISAASSCPAAVGILVDT
jgi:hypothetical protein